MKSEVKAPDKTFRKYQKNFLKQVIFRIDFTTTLKDTDTKRYKFQQSIGKIFGMAEPPQKMRKFEATLSDTQSASRVQDFDTYSFFDDDKVKKLNLSPDALVLEYSKYVSFKDLFEALELALAGLTKAYGALRVKQTGLRYLNVIDIEEGGDPFEWTDLISDDLTRSFKFPPLNKELSRAMNTLELTKSDYKVIFRFGLWNSEYPNRIAKKECILDYDCYNDDEQEINQIATLAKTLHNEIVNLFEASIGDDLRGIMDE